MVLFTDSTSKPNQKGLSRQGIYTLSMKYFEQAWRLKRQQLVSTTGPAAGPTSAKVAPVKQPDKENVRFPPPRVRVL